MKPTIALLDEIITAAGLPYLAIRCDGVPGIVTVIYNPYKDPDCPYYGKKSKDVTDEERKDFLSKCKKSGFDAPLAECFDILGLKYRWANQEKKKSNC
jgi:hypothetical protein